MAQEHDVLLTESEEVDIVHLATKKINKEIEELVSFCQNKLNHYATLAEFNCLTDFKFGQRDAYADMLNKLKKLQNG